jgi:hypothetical protein
MITLARLPIPLPAAAASRLRVTPRDDADRAGQTRAGCWELRRGVAAHHGGGQIQRLRSGEHELDELNRYAVVEAMKVYTAAPAIVLRVNEKRLREFQGLNCCGG